MKVEVKKVENKGFKPFKIEIEVETLEELKELHSRMNISDDAVNNDLGNDWCDNHLYSLFYLTENKLTENNIEYLG